MGGILYLGESLDLVDGELLQFRTHFEFLDADDLDGHDLAGLFVYGFVDLAKLTLANDVIQHVVFYLFTHVQLLLIIDNNNLKDAPISVYLMKW